MSLRVAVATGRDPTMAEGKRCRVKMSGGRGVEINVREFQLEGFSWLFAGDFLSLRKIAENPVNDVGTHGLCNAVQISRRHTASEKLVCRKNFPLVFRFRLTRGKERPGIIKIL